VTARSTDPEAISLMAELAARGDVQDHYNPLGNYLLELWEVSDGPDTAARVERVFAGLPPEHREFQSLPVGVASFRLLDAEAARAGLVALLEIGLHYVPASARRIRTFNPPVNRRVAKTRRGCKMP
jgi:hypothetical protein